MIDRQEAEFNMAVSYLNRLNYWFYIADDASNSLNGYKWFHALTILFRELSTEMKDNEIEYWKDKIKELNIKIIRNKQLLTHELYFNLMDFEMFLRKILKISGLQMRMKKQLLAAAKTEENK